MLFNQRLVTIPCTRQELGRRNQELSALLHLSNILSTCTDLETLWQLGLAMMSQQFQVSSGRVYLSGEAERELVLVHSAGLDPAGLERIDISSTFTGKAARTRSFLAMQVEDLEDSEHAELLLQHGIRMVICLPLITRDKVLGVMNLTSHKLIHLDMATIDLGMVMGNLIATAAGNLMQSLELAEKAELLEEQKQAVKFFAYTACHDMKSPATGVHGLACMLLKQGGEHLDPKCLEICRQIEKASGRIEALAMEVNEYIQASENPLELDEIDLVELVGEIAGSLEPRLGKDRVRLAPPPKPVKVKADRMSLYRALNNLIDNALKYGGPDLSHIEIRCRTKPDKVIICCADDGVGVPMEMAEKVFTLFRRGANTGQSEGSGLGLAIVQEVARRHGGRAWLEATPGGGACFCFSLDRNP